MSRQTFDKPMNKALEIVGDRVTKRMLLTWICAPITNLNSNQINQYNYSYIIYL